MVKLEPQQKQELKVLQVCVFAPGNEDEVDGIIAWVIIISIFVSS
jgi:hypothetical protein